MVLYLPVRSHPFTNYDDSLYVTDNVQVQSGLTWDTVVWSMTTFHVGTWHPVTWLSHALDCQLFELSPEGPHLVNALLHALNALLLFLVFARATGYQWRSLMVAALFAFHPINVESVAWIAERKNVLSMLFFLLAMGAYRWYAEKPGKAGAGRYAVVAVFFALGLMAKPQVITLPFVLLLWDYWPLRRMLADPKDRAARYPARKIYQLIEEKYPLFLIAALSAYITMKAQIAGGDKLALNLSIRLANAPVFYVRYILKMLWPSKLALFYPHPADTVAAWQVLGSLAFLAAVTYLVLRRGAPRYLAVGWLWFLGTMVPMIGLEAVGYEGLQGMADRYAYLPFIGLFLMICWGVADLLKSRRVPVMVPAVASVMILAALAVTSYRQLGYWSDNVSLWSHTLAVTDNNWLAENNLGRALLSEGHTEQGIAHFYKAEAIYPNDPVSNFNIGMYEEQHGNLTDALDHYRVAAGFGDVDLRVTALQHMGSAYRAMGDSESAQEALDAAARLKP